MQSKRTSFVEACINTAIGFTITLIFTPLINWLSDVQMTRLQMGKSVFYFTILSVLRSYLIRRFFNNRVDKKDNEEIQEKGDAITA